MPPLQPERDEVPVFEVTITEDGEVVNTSMFATLEEAEAFLEAWTERVPGARGEIEHSSHDHTAWEVVQTDTAGDESRIDDPEVAQPDLFR